MDNLDQKTINKDGSAVYLQLNEDNTWSADFSSNGEGAKALKLCDEKNYPVSVYYVRYDLNGSDVHEEDICHDRTELMESLNWRGACRHQLQEIWDFNRRDSRNPEINELFSAVYKANMDQVREDMDAFYPPEDVPLVEQASLLVDSVLDRPNGEEIFQLAKIIYDLRDVAPEGDLELLAQKTYDASLNSAVPLLTGERVDAVRCLLEYGVNANRVSGLPEATAEQMTEVLCNCDLDTFTEIVDSVALDNQEFYAADYDYSIEAQERKKAAVAYIESIINKKPSLEERIGNAAKRSGEKSNDVPEKTTEKTSMRE